MLNGFPGANPGPLVPDYGSPWRRFRAWNETGVGWRRLWQRHAKSFGPPSHPRHVGDARGPAWRDERMAKLEAVLFLAREPLSSRKISQLVNLADGTEARTLIRRLNRMYDESGSAFRVEELAGGFQLLTRPRFGPWLRRLLQRSVELRLSPPALETLAVVAYRQPVLRAEVEAIRGVQSGDILRQLMERDLLRISGRADELGRPLMYGTTKRFLQVFGLRHVDELPRAESLRRCSPEHTGIGDSTPPGPAIDEHNTPGASRADEAS
jgi:segregation and condensation protein B